MRNRYFLILDALLLALMPGLALGLRVDNAWAEIYRPPLIAYLVITLAVKLPLFYGFGLYQRYWRYASIDELINIVLAVVTASVVAGALFFGATAIGLIPGQGFPRSIPLIDGLLTMIVVGGTRFSVRAVDRSLRRVQHRDAGRSRRMVLVVGAGKAGELITREMLNSPHVLLEPIGFVDDDPAKRGILIQGLPVLGYRADLPRLVAEHEVAEVIIAMPTAPGRVIREIRDQCNSVGVPFKIMPGIFEILSGRVSVSQLRPVEIEDLLRRDPVLIDAEEVARLIAGARVLVTGGGGSIGSELCRQIARFGPAQLVVLGHGENSLFAIENELRANWPGLALTIYVADIRDQARLHVIFDRTRPQIVFHAAAHKHVPLMESNPEDAVTNNIGGTKVVVEMAECFGVERFVLISSDKAVNPSNVMGATKRAAELLVRAAAQRTGRPYVAVRFGNVLGSRGSVIPIFREQIARGGPVLVTHPDMERYFMTIPEAVLLVLQACALSSAQSPGEIYVLDMGEPVKIVNLARDLIELSGLAVGHDIDIVFTGLRPGEKLSEELFTSSERHSPTRHAKILAACAPEAGTLGPELRSGVEQLLALAATGPAPVVRERLFRLVAAYQPTPDPDRAGRPVAS